MSQPSIWLSPPESPSLEAGEVHVWRMELEQPQDVLEKFRSTLEADELQRASRFHFDKHRNSFVAARGFLRRVLSRYLDAKPEALRFSYGEYGKPALDGTLHFNMSHSHGLALLAITEGRQIGVDVEHIRADFATEDIARHFFSHSEVESFGRLQKEEQVAAFFRCWTRKEAFIKATGRGLSQPLDAFDVTLAPGVAAELLRVEADEASRWSMSDIDVGEDYAGALVVEGRALTIRFWNFSAG
ncbi:MAG TPA: 4'-phosphopantetheinyl transferase superfamily protein [Pyrinomonadaceae bacterium]|nr:4'-phosphopantetheinyl transferase superfamily protein [Pyrinomonadaceae bacterium]